MQTSDFLAAFAELLEVPATGFTLEYQLNDANFDSISVVGAIALIDEHFGVTVPLRVLVKCTSVGQVMDLIAASIPPNGPSAS